MSKIKKNKEILYGLHPVLESLSAARREFIELYLAKTRISKPIQKIFDLVENLHIPVKNVTSSELEHMTGTASHQGVGLMTGAFPTIHVQDLINKKKKGGGTRFLLLLDNIVDPQNFGALIRTALCAGIDGVVIPKNRSASPTPAVSKASAGALEHIDITLVTNLVDSIKLLQKQGVWIIGMDGSADQSVYEIDFHSDIAIVIGGEGKGIRPLVKKNCDYLISIPQKGPVGSLNASAAGAIVMYEAFRQRNSL